MENEVVEELIAALENHVTNRNVLVLLCWIEKIWMAWMDFKEEEKDEEGKN